jgi:hypothetical protein
MSSLKSLLIGTVAVLGAAGTLSAQATRPRGEVRRDVREVRSDRREVRHDKREVAGDRKEVVHDRHAIAGARAAGDSAAVIAGRHELRHDKHELKTDRRDLAGDRKDTRQDRRDLRRDVRDARQKKAGSWVTGQNAPATSSTTSRGRSCFVRLDLRRPRRRAYSTPDDVRHARRDESVASARSVG